MNSDATPHVAYPDGVILRERRADIYELSGLNLGEGASDIYELSGLNLGEGEGASVAGLGAFAPPLKQPNIYADVSDVTVSDNRAPSRLRSSSLTTKQLAEQEQQLPSSRSLSPTWRSNAPTQQLYINDFHHLLLIRDVKGVEALLRRAPGLVDSAKDGWTPLHVAVRVKSLPLLQLLVRGGADTRVVDASGRTAAALAAADGASGMATWLNRASCH
jgi:hypothetical protein